jgi:hypothetical protein
VDLPGRPRQRLGLVARDAVPRHEVVDDWRRGLAALDRGDEAFEAGGGALVDTLEGLVQIEPTERGDRRPRPAVLDPGRPRHEHESQQHEDVPLPPGRVPVAAERHGQQRLGEQDVCGEEGQCEGRLTTAVEVEVPPRGENVEHQTGDREDPEHGAGAILAQEAVQRWHPGERTGRPRRHHPDQPVGQGPL